MKRIRLIILSLTMLTAFGQGAMAQEITSFQGMWGPEFYQDKEKLTWKEIDKIMSDSQVSQLHWQKSKKSLLAGMGVAALNFGSGIWFIVNEADHKPVTGPVIAFAATGLVGSVFYHCALKNKKQAILNYNESLEKETSFRLVPTSNENGVGLALKF
ncbi:hypothetical protein [Pseudozobellia thermophila]|uniref:Uncharacterized protein n=1 Tax=Pseudozobellia thermophila TaxID=192903 RepID=A0A1M6JIG7_9FLAO|nr:hypothetical protein [Pseudozobellia thermophila]SHJ46460.1 hypothetical protein SAMN04488513_10539 [Pseudozobellia thermophila]